MPLIKRVASTSEAVPPQTVAPVVLLPLITPAPSEAPKYTGRKPAESKDDYWRNREERDLATGKMIRLSGVLQALLESVNFGQYCTGTTVDEYLTAVEGAALRLARFVTENAA